MIERREYENAERARFYKQLDDTSKQPKAWIVENVAELLESCKESPQIIAERAGWVLNGSYGYGAYKIAWHVAKEWRSKVARRSWFFMVVAGLEYGVPRSRVTSTYNKLTSEQRTRLDNLIDQEIDEAITNKAEEERLWLESVKLNDEEE